MDRIVVFGLVGPTTRSIYRIINVTTRLDAETTHTSEAQRAERMNLTTRSQATVERYLPCRATIEGISTPVDAKGLLSSASHNVVLTAESESYTPL